MPAELEQLVDSLLYEGYALYPYTPTATKNSTPTPFGIAYPPRYAAGLASTFDHVEMRCVLLAGPAARINAEVRFLAATGERHRALAHRLTLPEIGAWELLAGMGADGQPPQLHVDVDAGSACALRVALTSQRADARGRSARADTQSREPDLLCRRARSCDRAPGLADLDASTVARTGRALRLAAGASVREREHLPGARE